MNKKKILILVGVLVVGVLLKTSLGIAQEKYKGITLKVLCQGETPYTPSIQEFGKEFEKTTGAKILFELHPWETLMPKIITDVMGGAGQFDIFVNDIEFQYSLEPYLMPLEEYIEKYDYDMEGFFEPVYKYGVWSPKGVRYGLPIWIASPYVMYRTDLLEESGLSEFPNTWEEYHKFLAAHTGGDMYGLSRTGVLGELPKHFFAHYWSGGKPLLSPDWKPLVNSEHGVWSFETIKMEMENFMPPGALSWDKPDSAAAFLSGHAAVYEGWPHIVIRKVDNPLESEVVGKWALAPGYPEGGTGNLVHQNFVIMSATDNPEAAFRFIAYCTGPANAARLLERGATTPRKNFYFRPEVLAANPWLPNAARTIDKGIPFLPGVPQWLEMFIAVGEQVSGYLSGEISTAKAAADGLAAKWEKSIVSDPLSFKYKE